MHFRAVKPTRLFWTTLVLVSGCALDDRGLQISGSDASTFDTLVPSDAAKQSDVRQPPSDALRSDVAFNTGGVVGTGGVIASGGSSGSGGRGTGGTDPIAGHQGSGGAATGGATGSGGVAATGGHAATGGAASTGGRVGTGGGGTGGVTGTGGHPGTGGAPPATGGSAETGGRMGTGGSASGGRSGMGGTSPMGGGSGTGLGGFSGAAGMGGVSGQGGGSTATCNPTSCPRGCCNGNVCVTTNRTQQACGTAGSACAPCAACFQCSDLGACEVDRSSSWKLTCGSASIATTKTGGGTWDPVTTDSPSGAPDPFCEFQLNEIGQRDTSVITDSFNPVWNEDITPRNMTLTVNWLMSQAGSWSILVGDYDGVNNEEVCQIFPTLTNANFAAGTFSFSNQRSCISLQLQLTCNE